MSAWPLREDAIVERRVDAVLAVAERYGTTIPLDQLTELMPRGGPKTAEELARWLEDHPEFARFHAPTTGAVDDRLRGGTDDREARGRRYLAEAEALRSGAMRPVSGLVRCLAVTGSAAYGEPSRGDDLDLLVVTRRGAVWPFLLYSYMMARVRRPPPGVDDPSHLCLNYVVDERVARREFEDSRGFLFAREALTARPVAGEPYYRGLVGVAPWLAEEVPRLYERWRAEGLPALPKEHPAPAAVRALNALVFPLLASYVILMAMVRNRRYRQSGQSARCFRVEARVDRLTYETERFEELRAVYAPAGSTAVPSLERA